MINLNCFNFSALTMQFVSHCFLDYHDPTIGESNCVVQEDIHTPPPPNTEGICAMTPPPPTPLEIPIIYASYIALNFWLFDSCSNAIVLHICSIILSKVSKPLRYETLRAAM